MNLPSFGALRPSQIVEEYEKKATALTGALAAFEKAGADLKTACTIAGEWGNVSINTGNVSERDVRKSLLTSAWRHLYKIASIDRLATAREKRAFDQSMADPPPFTIDNIRATFGKYIADPRGSILKGLAEVFCDLDPAFKSHDKMKIGVKGLPKRIIISGVGSIYGSWGKDRLENVLNALATYQGKPLVERAEISALMSGEEALRESRGIRLRRFANGNGHLFFEPDTLADINRALAEFYGDVLPDAHEVKPERQRTGTAVAKDLQYYPTPVAVAERLVAELHIQAGQRVLEPSCGCGRILDALAKAGARRLGIEVDPGRAEEAMNKGHPVHIANFLETAPTGDFDHVAMNPPFYGRHYLKHIENALKFLKPGGTLVSILPATARYDHGVITEKWAEERGASLPGWNGAWIDLPVGSFSESGTNINTVILKMWRHE